MLGCKPEILEMFCSHAAATLSQEKCLHFLSMRSFWAFSMHIMFLQITQPFDLLNGHLHQPTLKAQWGLELKSHFANMVLWTMSYFHTTKVMPWWRRLFIKIDTFELSDAREEGSVFDNSCNASEPEWLQPHLNGNSLRYHSGLWLLSTEEN